MEEDLHKDPKYKKFSQGVDKILQTFDSMTEWTDVIGFLTRLSKIFKSHRQFASIPRKLIVCKRLAQCLNPGFPSGVHQKTLEVYDLMLDIIQEKLADDLMVYSFGLFPFLQLASTSVKPLLLSIYEIYYLPLGIKLRPCLRSFLLALLSGLEEEGNEFFDRVVNIIDRARKECGTEHFFKSLWTAFLTTRHLRISIINYLLKKLPNEDTLDKSFVASNHIASRSLSAALDDKDVLVQRGVLDIIISIFPLESKCFKEDDQETLMKFALSTVLKRDMSLNRRLYSWLLGTQEGTQEPSQTTKALIVTALKSMFFTTSENISDIQKPYRILVSLLDKPEIGQPIVVELFVDILISLKLNIDQHSEIKEEILKNANVFFEMVDPYIIWMKIFFLMKTIFLTPNEGNTNVLSLVDFYITSFFNNDIESKSFHMPLFFLGMLSKLNNYMEADHFQDYSSQIPIILTICDHILMNIAPSVIEQTEVDSSNEKMEGRQDYSNFYEIMSDYYSSKIEGHGAFPLYEIFEGGFFIKNALLLLLPLIKKLCLTNEAYSRPKYNSQPKTSTSLRLCFAALLSMLKYLASKNNQNEKSTYEEYDDDEWVELLVRTCSTRDDIQLHISCLYSLYDLTLKSSFIKKGEYRIKTRSSRKIFLKLWNYLSPHLLPYHFSVTKCICHLIELSQPFQVEMIMCESLTSASQTSQNFEQYERFLIFWKVSESLGLDMTGFTRPLFIVYDKFRSKDLTEQYFADKWLRLSLASFSRMLDPLLCVLVHPNIHRIKELRCINEVQYTTYRYGKGFNQAQTIYAFEVVTAMVKFGKDDLLQSMLNEEVSTRLLHSLNENDTMKNYLELLLEIVIKFLNTATPSDWIEFEQKYAQSLQLQVLELLLELCYYGQDFGNVGFLFEIEGHIIHKLYDCIQEKNLYLQGKLLLLLQNVLMVKHIRLSNDNKEKAHLVQDESIPITSNSELVELPSLLYTILNESMTSSSNRAILSQWIDFFLGIVPIVKDSLVNIVIPFIDNALQGTKDLMNPMEEMFICSKSDDNTPPNPPILDIENELLLFLDAIERISLFCLENRNVSQDTVKYRKEKERQSLHQSSSRGWADYVTNVFASDTSLNGDGGVKDKMTLEVMIGYLGKIIRVLVDCWFIYSKHCHQQQSEQNLFHIGESAEYFQERVQKKIIQILQKISILYPNNIVECFVEIWVEVNNPRLDLKIGHAYQNDVFEILTSIPEFNHKVILNCCLDSIRLRIPSVSGRLKRLPVGAVKVLETGFIQFLESYFSFYVKEDKENELSNIYLAFIKDLFPQASPAKTMFPYILRFLTVSLPTTGESDSQDDKKQKRDVFDTYQRVCDYCILIAGRSFDQGLWIRRSARESTFEEWQDSPDPENTQSLEKSGPQFSSAENSKQSSRLKEDYFVYQVIDYIGYSMIPNLTTALCEQERISSILVNIVYYIIGPTLRTRPIPSLSLMQLLRIFSEMSKIPFAFRIWKKEAWELFMDTKFFAKYMIDMEKWKIILQSILQNEKEKVNELLSRISQSSSGVLFSSKEQETLNRNQMIRRLSFAVFCGEKDQYVPYLPNIQEKIVEIFKIQTRSTHSEIYFFLRVLFLRISEKHLTNLCPIFLSELIRLFSMFQKKGALLSGEDLNLFVSSCRFLDFLFTLEVEQFQVLEWIFISDWFEGQDSLDVEECIYPLLEKIGKQWREGASEKEKSEDLPCVNSPSIQNFSSKRPFLYSSIVGDREEVTRVLEGFGKNLLQSRLQLGKPDITYLENLVSTEFLELNVDTESTYRTNEDDIATG